MNRRQRTMFVRSKMRLLPLLSFLLFVSILRGEELKLPYAPAPVDNPLQGLVPYARPTPGRFPHSMEFSYLPLSDLMTGYESFNWNPLEELLDDIVSRRHQAIFRIWLEYPGRADGIPKFLLDDGLKVTEWKDTNTAPFPPKSVRTPDYSDPRLRKALRSFILALGRKYDGDPRIGFVTAGLLGTWGEWHTYPREELMADKEVQTEVMQAFEKAFKSTPILLRYPAGTDAWAIAANHDRPFGYHDDSFAWATLDTGRKEDSWFYMAALKQAGPPALEKWKTDPIGGEIRPELWGKIFDAEELPEHGQDFVQCVKETHVSWLMDTGMFREAPSKARKENATRAVQQMGYEFHLKSVEWIKTSAIETQVNLKVDNKGVAPFYYDWKLELGVFKNAELIETIRTDWSLVDLLPDSPTRTWALSLPTATINPAAHQIAVRVVNPLPNGIPLRFANKGANKHPDGWLFLPSQE